LSFIQKSKNVKFFSLGTIKIIIIILASVYLIGSFATYYEGKDAFLYGSGGIDIIQGSYEYTNEILQKTDFDYIFAAGPYVETKHDTLIPDGSFGMLPLAGFSYLLGGYYGLFYLGPITTILFLIISERVVTKLFGGFAGLAVLIFLSTDKTLLNVGSQLLTDSVFSLLLILGCFFLIKFLKEKTNTSILFCSSFLAAATFFRYAGAIFLLIEILLISGYFLFEYIKTRKKNVEISDSSNLDLNLTNVFSKIKIKKILKISLYILGPWSIFFIFLFSFNIYFFGEPFTTYFEQRQGAETGNIILSSLTFDSERFESIKSYSVSYAPDRTYFLVRMISLGEVLLNQYSLSIISFTYLFSALLISIYFKINRTEIIVFIVFILSLLSFYSSNSLVSLTGITGRYMIPALPLSFGIIGYLMYRAWKIDYQRIPIKYFQIFSKSWKGFLIIIFALFFLSTLYYSQSIDSLLIKQNFEFKNPQNFADRYPLDQGPKVITGRRGGRAHWGHVASRWQKGRQGPHLRDRQQVLVALPEQAQDDAFKIPATHRRQIPERACLITLNGVDKTIWTQHSEYSAAQPELDLDNLGCPSMLPPRISTCLVECLLLAPSCVWPLPSVSVLFCSSLLLGITHSCPRATAHTDSSPGNTNNFLLGYICFSSGPGSVAIPDCLVLMP